MKENILFKSEDGVLYFENEIPHMLDGVFIHWDIYNWSPSKVKTYKKMWKTITDFIFKEGAKAIYALPPTEFEERLIKMFGFEYTGLTFHGYKIMKFKEI